MPTYTPLSDALDDYVLLDGWYGAGASVAFEIVTPGGIHLGPIAPGDSLVDQDTPDGYVNAYNGTSSPSNGDRELYVEIFDGYEAKPPKTGEWLVRAVPLSPGAGQVDLYIEDQFLGGGEALAGWGAGAVFGGVVNAPGDADSVIAVAAYTTKPCWDAKDGHTYCWNPTPTNGIIASFSSQGPRRDGRLKPDLAAPGFGVAAPLSGQATFADSYITPDGAHVVQAGTSFSTPHVAGAVALLLSQGLWAHAGPTAILQRLEQTARSDGFTGVTPNATWGYGKLDVAAAMGPGLSVHILRPSGHFESTTGAPDSVQVAVEGGTADSLVLDLSQDAGVHFDHRLGVLPGAAPGTVQTLVFQPTEAMKSYRAKIRGTAYDAVHGNSTGFSDSLFLVEPPIQFGVRAVTMSPFSKDTIIRYELDRAGPVSLRVFSVAGRLVRTLIRETIQTAGRHDVHWDGRSDRGDLAPSGVYFCKLVSQDGSESGRILLIR
jgi:hypothetical protein